MRDNEELVEVEAALGELLLEYLSHRRAPQDCDRIGRLARHHNETLGRFEFVAALV